MSTREDLYEKQNEFANAAYYTICDRIITLATGSLALSIAFRGSIAGASPIYLWLLKLSWIAFTAASITAVTCLSGKVRGHVNYARALLDPAIENPTASPGKFYVFCGHVMWAAFILGVASLAVFAIINVR